MNDNRMCNFGPYIPWYSDDYLYSNSSDRTLDDYLSMKPQDIKAGLEKHVVNQEEACRKVAIMMYRHLHGHRFVGLLAGPTGSGKSFIAESLKEMFPEIVYIRDVANLTCDGWKGDKKVSTLLHGVMSTGVQNRMIFPLLFLDECDKLFSPKITLNGENVSESTQSELLSFIHGSEIEVTEKRNIGHGTVETTRLVDTTNMSFLFAGAFEKNARAIARKESGSAFGFGGSHIKLSSYNRELNMEDVMEAGCMSELCGRIQRIVCLHRIEESQFRSILDFKDRGPVFEMEKEYGISINISEEKKEEFAHIAYTSGLGIRGIKNTIQEYIDELIWEDCRAGELEI